MKREALIRKLVVYANTNNLDLVVKTKRGKGSHYRATLGGLSTTIQYGELDPRMVDRICKQLKIDPKDL